MLRSFAQARIQDEYQRQEVGCTEVDDNDFFADAESQVVGDEESMIFYNDFSRCPAKWWAFSVFHFTAEQFWSFRIFLKAREREKKKGNTYNF